ncbi:acyclic terpene utilization AtuA family protein [Amycolatopsis pigmentata]|uniref:Acyclic terpene utilization AtuA family protein n=1 Tax=Amycolatopsis pigmentata TaxID=450801 RepID=A0ABW5FNV7_9PSEU
MTDPDHDTTPIAQPTTGQPIRIIFPVGMLGAGFPPDTVSRGIALGADAIAVDAGSTDSGPYYLGTGTAKTTATAVSHDLRILLTQARAAGIPLIVTSCGTSGTDDGVDWLAEMALDIAKCDGLTFRMARIYSEQHVDTLLAALADGRIHPLPPSEPAREETLRSCSHIVGVMGHEPIAAALDAGADVVLTGRATDTASVAALALRRGLPPGPAWHAAKTVECGALCTTDPSTGAVLVTVDMDGFTVEPLADTAACTPTTVAAHMLYENADPFRMREPAGTLNTVHATYTALDDRRVRVAGSRFEPAEQHTIKMEGSAPAGHETVSLVGIRSPRVLDDLKTWVSDLESHVTERTRVLLGIEPEDYQLSLRCYGSDAVLGELEPEVSPPREVAVLFRVRAATQALATAIAKIANPSLLHHPLPQMTDQPSFAFAMSPAEIERGVVYEFVLNHVVDVRAPAELFRAEYSEVAHA